MDEPTQTTFADMFKNSFLNMFPETVDPWQLVTVLAVSLLLGLCIYAVYRRCFMGVVYDHSFAISLVIMTVLVSVIIVTISSNVMLSLGMVGAPSPVVHSYTLYGTYNSDYDSEHNSARAQITRLPCIIKSAREISLYKHQRRNKLALVLQESNGNRRTVLQRCQRADVQVFQARETLNPLKTANIRQIVAGIGMLRSQHRKHQIRHRPHISNTIASGIGIPDRRSHTLSQRSINNRGDFRSRNVCLLPC